MCIGGAAKTARRPRPTGGGMVTMEKKSVGRLDFPLGLCLGQLLNLGLRFIRFVSWVSCMIHVFVPDGLLLTYVGPKN